MQNSLQSLKMRLLICMMSIISAYRIEKRNETAESIRNTLPKNDFVEEYPLYYPYNLNNNSDLAPNPNNTQWTYGAIGKVLSNIHDNINLCTSQNL